MKLKTWIMAIPFLVCVKSFAQSFGTIGSEWYFNRTSNTPPDAEYQHFRSVMDTLIQGINVHKITQTNYHYKKINSESKPSYMFERNDTVFFFDFKKNAFLKFCIFNAKKCDTLNLDMMDHESWMIDETFRLSIDSVEMVKVKNQNLKLYYATVMTDTPYFNNRILFMDRLGYLDWFFPEYTPTIPASGRIRCYSDWNLDTNFSSKDCDFQNTVVNNYKDDEINIYPNPVADVLHIDGIREFKYRVLDSYGREISAGDSQGELDCCNLNKGIYVLEIIVDSKVKRMSFIKE